MLLGTCTGSRLKTLGAPARKTKTMAARSSGHIVLSGLPSRPPCVTYTLADSVKFSHSFIVNTLWYLTTSLHAWHPRQQHRAWMAAALQTCNVLHVLND